MPFFCIYGITNAILDKEAAWQNYLQLPRQCRQKDYFLEHIFLLYQSQPSRSSRVQTVVILCEAKKYDTKANNCTKILLPMYQSTWCNIPKDCSPNAHSCEHLGGLSRTVAFLVQASLKQISTAPNYEPEATVLYLSLYLLQRWGQEILPRWWNPPTKLHCHIPHGHNLNTHCHKNFKPYIE